MTPRSVAEDVLMAEASRTPCRRAHRRWPARLLAVVVLGTVPMGAGAQETPSNLQLLGTIASGDSGVAPSLNDEVRVVAADDRSLEGVGSVVDPGGTYFIELSKPSSFDGSVLALELATAEGKFALEFGADSTFTYAGGFPFPSRRTINAVVGAPLDEADEDTDDEEPTEGDDGTDGGETGGGGTDDGAGDDAGDPPPTAGEPEPSPGRRVGDPANDVNGDGIFNEADVDFVAANIRSSRPDARADVNGDGRVTTRDAIALIRQLSVTSQRGRVVFAGEDASGQP
jgi:hypothetical protein